MAEISKRSLRALQLLFQLFWRQCRSFVLHGRVRMLFYLSLNSAVPNIIN